VLKNLVVGTLEAMPHISDKRDPWGLRLGLWVLVFMAFTLPLAGWGVSRLRIDNDVEQWLSGDSLSSRQFDWYKQSFSTSDSLLVSWDGSSLEDPRVDLLATRLAGVIDSEGIRRGGVKQVSAVHSPHQLMGRMAELKIDRTEAVRRITGVLAGPGRIWCNFSTAGLNQKAKSIRALQDAAVERFGIELTIVEPIITMPSEEEELAEEEAASLEATSTDSEAQSDSVAGDAANIAAEAVLSIIEEAKQHDIELSWRDMHTDPNQIEDFIAWARELKLRVAGENAHDLLLSECYLHPGQPVALRVVLSEAGKADRAEAITQIRQAAVAVGIAPETLHLGGRPVETAAVNQEFHNVFWNSEAPWYRPIERSVVLFSLLVAVGGTFWLLRDVRLASIVVSVSLMTILMSAALVSVFGGRLNVVLIVVPILSVIGTLPRTLHLANCWKTDTQRDGRRTIAGMIKAARLICVVTFVSTSLGVGALMTSQSSLIRDFALCSAIGTLLSGISVLYVVPTLLQVWPQASSSTSTIERRLWTRLGRRIVRHSPAVLAAGLVLAAVSIYGLRDFHTEVRAGQYFANQSGLVQDETFLEQNVGGLESFETVICFGKVAREESQFIQRLEIVRSIEAKIRKIADISGTLSLADFEPITEPLDENASGRKLLVFNAGSRTVETRWKQEPRAKSLFQVAPEDSEFSNTGDELWRISCQAAMLTKAGFHDLTDEIDQACRSVTKYHPDTRHVVTGVVPRSLAAQIRSLENLIYSFGLGFVLMALVIAATVRSLPAGLLSLLPIVLPMGMVLGLSALLGVRFNAGLVLTSVVALAFSVDGTVHLMSQYREGVIAGLAHRRAVVKSVEQVGPVLWQSCAIIVLASWALYQSQFVMFSQLGWLTSLLIGATLLTASILTPALLAGPLGWLIFRAATKQRNRLKTVSEDPDSGAPMRHEPHLAPPKPQIVDDPRHSRAHRFDETPGSTRKKRK